MVDSLNTPEHILNNLKTIASPLAKIDAALGEQRFKDFAESLSSLFAHINPKEPGLASRQLSNDSGAKLALYVISACVELQTAWNVLRLGNIPSCQRTVRVSTELIAAGVLILMPRSVLLTSKKCKSATKVLRMHNDCVFKLCNAHQDKITGEVTPPQLHATQVTALFLDLLENALKADAKLVASLHRYRNEIHHPFAHGTTEVWSQHFATMSNNRAGLGFDSARIPLYCDCADGVIQITDHLTDVLNIVADFLTSQTTRQR